MELSEDSSFVAFSHRSSDDDCSKEPSIQVSDGINIAAVRVGDGGHVILGRAIVLIHYPLVGDNCLVLHTSVNQIGTVQGNEAAADLQVCLKGEVVLQRHLVLDNYMPLRDKEERMRERCDLYTTRP